MALSCATAEDVLKTIKDEKVQMIDLRFTHPPNFGPYNLPRATLVEGSMRGEIINQYQKLNSEDQKTFRRWLWANTVVGAILLTGLIAVAVTSKLPGDESGATAKSAPMHTQANLPEG
jgi:hypothetical protein